MIRFFLVFVIAVLVIIGISLSWPRFSTAPRPQILEQVNTFVRSTAFGQQAANVLGVSNEQSMMTLSPQDIKDSGIQLIKNYATDIVVTHATRLIISKFGSLPLEQQQKILEALSQSLSTNEQSQSEQLPESSQSGTNTDNNSRTDQ